MEPEWQTIVHPGLPNDKLRQMFLETKPPFISERSKTAFSNGCIHASIKMCFFNNGILAKSNFVKNSLSYQISDFIGQKLVTLG